MVSERQLGEAKAYAYIVSIFEKRMIDLLNMAKDEKSPREAIMMTLAELSYFKTEIENLTFRKASLDDKLFEPNDTSGSNSSGSLGPDNAPSGSGS